MIIPAPMTDRLTVLWLFMTRLLLLLQVIQID
jgi:hypothetical protein